MNIQDSQTAEGRRGYLFNSFYYYYPLHRHLDINRAITAESSPVHIANSQQQKQPLVFEWKSLTISVVKTFLMMVLWSCFSLLFSRGWDTNVVWVILGSLKRLSFSLCRFFLSPSLAI